MADSIGKGFPSVSIQIGHLFCDIDDNSLWKFLGNTATAEVNWVVINGTFQGTPPAFTQWGLRQAGALWFNAAIGEYFGWDGTALAPIAFGQGLNLYNARKRFTLQEDFIGGNQNTGFLGTLGWQAASTLLIRSGERNAPGILRIDTTAVSGTQARLNFTSVNFNRAYNHEIVWIARPNQVDANTLIRIGAANGVSANPPNDGVYFEKLDADTNWFCVVRISGGGPTRVDSGVPVAVTLSTFKYVYNGVDVKFYINNVLVSTQTTTMTGLIGPFVFILNSAAASKTMDMDYFHLISDVER